LVMSALGKHILEGDFDSEGQVVVQTPVERVIERSVVVTRTVTEAPVLDERPRLLWSVFGARPPGTTAARRAASRG